MWMLAAGGALVLSASSQTREWLASVMGTAGDTHSSVIAIGLLFLAGICLDLSSKVSRLANQQKTLAQDLSRLHKQVEDFEPPAPEPD